MTYNVTLSNGNPGPVISDYNENTQTSLVLAGRGSSNYGISLASNFVHLLENFANTTAPNAPLIGQLWYNSLIPALQYWSGQAWVSTVSQVTVASEIAAATASFITSNQTITLSGDVTGSGATAITTTLATVNSAPGAYTLLTVNAKGLVTTARNLLRADLITLIGYESVQQGGGIGQSNNKVYVGWTPDASGLKATVDTTDEGYILTATVANNIGLRGGFATYQFQGYDGNGNNPTQYFTVPAGVTVVKIICTGGGGGGCGSYNQGNGLYISAGGGGAAGTAIMFAAVTPGQILSLVVGPGGAISGVFSNGIPDVGKAGSTSIVYGYLYAFGGSGAVWQGAGSAAGGGGAGGIIANNVALIVGGDGGDGMNGTIIGVGGHGGSSYWGGGARGGGNNGISAYCFGAGGGGSYTNVGQYGYGGAGGNGFITFEW